MDADKKLKAIEEQWLQEADIIDEERFDWMVARIKKLTKALKWYGKAATWTDPRTMIMTDLGKVALTALEDKCLK